MASAGERLQKLSVEAFTRLRNDHEQFLEAYEKPTQIYRFLHARHSFKSLFMHRNLSYMQHRKERRKRRTNRLRISDLLKYRKHCQLDGEDLASQIKSDNFLKITFHDLEKGIDFGHLLSSALTGDVNSEPPTCHTPCLMEVEVLLYSCHQHLSEGMSYPCSSISLGKFEVEYTPSKDGKVSTCSSSSSSHTLTIPESKLVWQGTKNRATGSLMLVFHARPSGAGRGHNQKKPPLLSSGVIHHHQSQLANVSVEVNRIHHSDIAQLARARQTSSSANCESTGDSGTGGKSSVKQAMSSSSSSQNSGCGECASNTTSLSIGSGSGTHPKAQRKTQSSKAKERRDACIMTDLSLGTGAALPCPPISSSSSSLPNSNIASDQSPTPQESSTTARPPSPPPPFLVPKIGFTETGASLVRKLVVAQSGLRNGLNGLVFLNGYPENHHNHQSKEPIPCNGHNGRSSLLDHTTPLSNSSLTVSIPCTASYQNGNTLSSTSSSTTTDTHSHSTQQPIPSSAKQRHQTPPRNRPQLHTEPHDQPMSSSDDITGDEDTLVQGTAQQQQSGDLLKMSHTQLDNGAGPHTYSTTCPDEMVDCRTTSGRGGGVKRSLSESDTLVDLDVIAPQPPLKIARLSGSTVLDEGLERDVEIENGRGWDTSETEMDTDVILATDPEPETSPKAPSIDHALHNRNSTTPNRIETETSTATGTAPEGLFSAEVVVFDSRGECLLDEGEYSILMQKCPEKDATGAEGPPRLFTFSPLSWTSVFGANDQEKAEESENMMLKFSLSWSHGPPKHRLVSELETALDLQRIRNDYFPPSPCSQSPNSSKAVSPVAASGGLHGADMTESSRSPVVPASAPEHPLQLNDPHDDRGEPFPTDNPGCMEERDGEGGRAVARQEEGVTAKPHIEATSEREEGELADRDSGKSSSREVMEEYFTATEASASSSVADSTELVHCRMSPLATSSGESKTDQERRRGRRERDRILYNFLYNNNSLQQTESRGDMQCPWCSLLCRHLYSLLKHMSLCHPRFLFTYTPMQQGGSVIDVHVNKLYGAGQTSMDQDPMERSGMNLKQRWRGPLKCLPCTAVLVERHESLEEDLSEFLNDGSWKRGYNVKRQFYHSGTCLPMVPEEIDADSEAELDSISKWQKICSQKMIDEFTDVNKGEKEMMKLWNLFAMERGMIADKHLPNACVRFSQEKGSEILQRNHVHSFLAHLVSLCQFGLISLSVIKTSMDIINAKRPFL